MKLGAPLAFVLSTVLGSTRALAHEPRVQGGTRDDAFVCSPCACDSDDEVFDAPGNCPSCGMALVTRQALERARASAGGPRETGPSDLYEIEIEPITEDIYLAYRKDPLRTFVEGNVTIIVNEQDVVVVDASGSPVSARNVIAEIKRLTPLPVRHLVITHFHYDHTLGIQEYVKAFPGVEVIAHRYTREQIVGGSNDSALDFASTDLELIRVQGELELQSLRDEGGPDNAKVVAQLERYYYEDMYARQAAYREAVITPPTTTFEQRLTLHRGERTIEILFLGVGDTPGDAVIYLPRERFVCTGDMVTEPIPYGFTSQPLEWLETLQKLAELDFEWMIPGHGAPQQGKAYLQRLIALLQSVQAQLEPAVAEGLAFEEARRRVDLTRFVDEFCGSDPVRRYYFEAYTCPTIEQTFQALRARMEQRRER